MTLLNALLTLKEKGITSLSGLHGEKDIEKYIANARRNADDAQKYISQSWAQYHIEHADDHFIIEVDGHCIIATHYDGYDMETYGDYETEIDLRAAFYKWRLIKEANEIADEMLVKRPNELTRDEWVLVAMYELKEQRKKSAIAFAKEFKTSVEHFYL